MPTRTSNIHLLRQRVIESSKRSSPHLVGSKLTESGVLDRAVLNRQIDEILDGLGEKPSLAPRLERSLDAFLKALNEGDVARTAKHVCAMLKPGTGRPSQGRPPVSNGPSGRKAQIRSYRRLHPSKPEGFRNRPGLTTYPKEEQDLSKELLQCASCRSVCLLAFWRRVRLRPVRDFNPFGRRPIRGGPCLSRRQAG